MKVERIADGRVVTLQDSIERQTKYKYIYIYMRYTMYVVACSCNTIDFA